MFHVIIPAAGVGTRLRPHTHTTPKALLPVAGRPILGHILDRLVDLPGLGSIYVVVGFLGDQIKAYVRETYKRDVRFVDQFELRGLGFAVHLALAEMKSDDPVLVILGDTILDLDWSAFMSAGEDALGLVEVDDPRRFGVVELEGGFVKRLVEKPVAPPSNWAVVGLYGIHSTALLRRCLDDLVAGSTGGSGEVQMTDALQLFVQRGGRLRGVPVAGWYDCGNLETLLKTNRHLLDVQGGRHEVEGSLVVPPVYIAPSARVQGSVLGPHVSIGRGAQVTDSVIRDSIIADGARVSHCVLSDSVVGAGTVVEGTARRLNVGEGSEIGLS